MSDAAAAVFIISQEDIRRSGVTTIPDALAMAPGIQVAKISASKWSVSSRGFPGLMSNKLLVLIDGRSVYSPLYSGVFWDSNSVMLEDIERIEVIRGPGGTLWGANAVNGVINIITKKAADTQGGLVRVGAGDQEPLTTAARYGGKISDTAFGRLYVLYNDHGSNALTGSGADADDDWQPMQGGFRMDGTPGNGKEWTLQGDLYRNQGDQILSPYWISTPPFQLALHDEVDTSGGNLLGRWRQEVTADSAVTLQAYFDRNTRDELLYNWQYDTLDFEVQYDTTIGQRQRLTVGSGYRTVQGDVTPNFQLWFPDRTDELYSVFAQDEITLFEEALWLTLGSKYERNDYTGEEWQPSAKLLWKPAANHSLWTSVARAVVTPTVTEQQSRITLGVVPFPPPYSTIGFVGNPSCGSEELWAYEAGYRWQASKSLSFDLALFYNDYDDLFTMVPSSTSYDIQFMNGVSGSGRGVELSADWLATSWRSFALAYSYLDMQVSPTDGINQEVASARYNEGSPQHQVSLRSSIALAKHWRLNMWGRYVDNVTTWDMTQPGWPKVIIDGYFSLDANLIWTPNEHLEVMFAGQNLTNSGQLQYISEYSTPSTEIERGVYGKLTWRF
jgi:iron complex outermembrane receptor protein